MVNVFCVLVSNIDCRFADRLGFLDFNLFGDPSPVEGSFTSAVTLLNLCLTLVLLENFNSYMCYSYDTIPT